MQYKMIDLFAGCGGLEDGFLQSGRYEDVAAVEWLQPQVKTLIKRLKAKWGISDADERVMCFDVQREEELFNGWTDNTDAPSPELLPNGKKSRYKTGPYGDGKGLDYFVNKAGGIDIIIGGPPCQAYSVAGRVRDENGMRDDYRNYLFEHYLSVVNRYKPKVFVFENVPGLLSAMPDGTPITSEDVGIIFPTLDGTKNTYYKCNEINSNESRTRFYHQFEIAIDRDYSFIMTAKTGGDEIAVMEYLNQLLK